MNINAERFIPTHKQLQWDQIPSVVLLPSSNILLTQSSSSTTTTSTSTSTSTTTSNQNLNNQALLQWINNPTIKRSLFDLSTVNLLHYIPNDLQQQQHHGNSRNLLFVLNQYHTNNNDNNNTIHQELIHIRYQIEQNKSKVLQLQNELIKHLNNNNNNNNEFNPQPPKQQQNHQPSITQQQQYQNRIMNTTPESLAKLCDQFQSLISSSTSNNNENDTSSIHHHILTDTLELYNKLNYTIQDYISKLSWILDIERIQIMNDVNVYDMYSVQFEYIEILPPLQSSPLTAMDVMSNCLECRTTTTTSHMHNHGNMYNQIDSCCTYHTNINDGLRYYEYNKNNVLKKESQMRLKKRVKNRKLKNAKNVHMKKPSIVNTPNQFDRLSHNLLLLGGHGGGDGKIIVYLHVPGVAENRPLISRGDFIRFRFFDPNKSHHQYQEEVIGEVNDIEIKTETIMIFLPIPVNIMYTCPGFYDALMNPKNKEDVMGNDNSKKDANQNQKGLFDVRFGIFSARAHDIFKATVHQTMSTSIEQIRRVIAPIPFMKGVLKKSDRRAQIGISDWANALNSEQKHAVFDIVRKNHGEAPYLIYGPPGTGKTMCVVETIFQLLRHDLNSKILVCAPSDAACDVVAMRLITMLPSVCKVKRVNWWSRNPASLPPKLLGCSSMNDAGLFVLPSEEELRDASVVVCQCFVAGFLDSNHTQSCRSGIGVGESWMRNHFSHVFIDESSQSFEFEALIPLLKVGRECSIILAGDPRQLGPTVRSQCAARNGLSLSLQERLMGLSLYQLDSNYCVITKLVDNYRSHDALLRVPSELFYTGSLRCKASIDITSSCEKFELLRDGHNFPMMVYDVHDGKEQNKIDTPSFYNIKECETVVKLIKALLASPNVDINTGQIAVITCFRAQVLKLREILRKEGLGAINVGVVEDFQGQETSVVLISTVLTKVQERWMKCTSGGLGFMTDPKRFNVAITRASALCVIVGKVSFLEESGSYWTALIEHVKRHGGISGESKFISNDDEYGVEADYGMGDFIERVKELKLSLGSGHEIDRYNMTMQGYYQEAPEWKVCL